MNNDCLEQGLIKLLETRRLRGRRLAAALVHLESCAACRARIKPATLDEIVRQIAAGNTSGSPPDLTRPPATEPDQPPDDRRVRKKSADEPDNSDAPSLTSPRDQPSPADHLPPDSEEEEEERTRNFRALIDSLKKT